MATGFRKAAIVALAAGGAAGLVGLAALAQQQAPTTTAGTAADAADETPIDDGVIVPRRSDAGPSGPLGSKEPGGPDWEQVRATIAAMKERDAEFDRQLRAMQLSGQVSEAERERLRPKGLRAAAPEQFQRVAVEQVKRTRVPLLAPLTADTVSSMRIVAGENAYTALGELPNGAAFELIGTRMRVVGGGPDFGKMRAAMRSRAKARIESINAPYVLSRHEQGVDLSFSKFNCAYMITIYCPDPSGDARCSEDGFVRSLADNLAILNETEGGTP